MLNATDIRALTGLSQAEVQRRLSQDGPNELPRRERPGFLRSVVEVLREPMILLLVAAGAVYVFLGDREEAILLLGSICLIIGIELYQEHRTEHALEALRDLSSPRAVVIRDGLQRRVPGREVVVDDLLVLREGDRVAADAVMLWCTNLAADESLLTGESVPVRKLARPLSDIPRPGGDDLPYVYSGSLLTSGQGVGRVVATGARTEMGRIGTALQAVGIERTRLQNETDGVVRVLAVVALIVCAFIVIAYGLARGNLIAGLLAAIAVAMSLIPEEFPVVLTVFLALGAWRIARRHVLTRHIPAIEALGAATVLCVDKTGTLTQNRMSVARLTAGEGQHQVGTAPLPSSFQRLVELGMLASQVDPYDPTERAIKQLHDQLKLVETDASPAGSLVKVYPLSDELLAMSHVWDIPDEAGYTVAAKGAPEAVAELCQLNEEARGLLAAQVRQMAEAGLRVLGVAEAHVACDTPLPKDRRAFRYNFIGLIGLADPIRPSVPEAVAESYRAGIRVVMLTGDYPVTAQNIARQVGLHPLDPVISGPEIDGMDDAVLREHVRRSSIFARVRPEQKLRLVQALKANGEIVAMTGDGVNDAPALKASHIGIAMGERGTDVAREAAALVLLDDDFTSIVRAVRLGRRIVDNLRKAMAFLLAVHVPIAGLALLPLVLGWPLLLLPIHIVFLELIIDPACSIVFESEREEHNVMRRPPRSVDEPLFDHRTVVFSLLQGLGVLLVSGGVLTWATLMGFTEPDARMLTFSTLVIGDLGLILANRGSSGIVFTTVDPRNRALGFVLAGALVLLVGVTSVPGLRDLFGFGAVHLTDLLIILLASCLALLWLVLVGIIRQRVTDAFAGTAAHAN